MIRNDLDESELLELLRPVLRLAPADQVLATLARVLHVSSQNTEALMCQRETLVTFEGYRLDVTDLRWVADKAGSIILQFKAPQKWWHGWVDQNRTLVRTLQRLCALELKNLKWSEYIHDSFDELGKPISLRYFYDGRAFNESWQQGYEISPLLIGSDAHDGKCFVQFMFNGGAYVRTNRTTALRDDWRSSVCDIREDIQRSADALTADFLAGKPTSLGRLGFRLVAKTEDTTNGE